VQAIQTRRNQTQAVPKMAIPNMGFKMKD